MIKPQRLRPGDKAAIVSLSHGSLGKPQFIHKYYLAKERLERDYGLQVVAMPNALKGIDYLYQHPEARARDLMDAFRDPSIKAVFCAIGGSDTIRLLPYIDFDVLRNNPKIFTGFSDTTVNHLMMYKAGLTSYYGGAIMTNWAEYGAINEYTADAFDKTLFHPQERWTIPASGFCSYETDRVLWDEAANTGQVPNLEKLVAVIRSREVSLTLFYQQLAQCKAIYDKNAETILGNMDSVVFLGGREASTIKEISENWLGKGRLNVPSLISCAMPLFPKKKYRKRKQKNWLTRFMTVQLTNCLQPC